MIQKDKVLKNPLNKTTQNFMTILKERVFF